MCRLVSRMGWSSLSHFAHRIKKPLSVGAASVGCSVLLAVMHSTNAQLVRQTNPLAVKDPRTWLGTFGLMLPSWLLIGLAFPAVTAAARRFSFQKNDRLRSSVVHIVLSLAFAVILLLTVSTIYTFFTSHQPSIKRFEYQLWLSSHNLFFLEILVYWTIIGVYLMLRASQLKSELAEAQLKALRAQLNPHFLFNTLNAVSALAMREDHNAVVTTLAALGDLLRASLNEDDLEVSLEREIELTQTYIELQQIRFPRRLKLATHYGPETGSALVPSMLLQPLVENSVIHGLCGDRRSLTVTVTARRHNSTLTISVADDGPGFSMDEVIEGIGLTNTRARLHQLYGVSQTLQYGNRPSGGGLVTVTLPWRRKERLRVAV
jgi:two-component system, LytTR family, sensor kinase